MCVAWSEFRHRRRRADVNFVPRHLPLKRKLVDPSNFGSTPFSREEVLNIAGHEHEDLKREPARLIDQLEASTKAPEELKLKASSEFNG